MRIGPSKVSEGEWSFRLWAPTLDRVELEIVHPQTWRTAMKQGECGYWQCVVEGVSAGDRYFYIVDGETRRPDPASRFQPQGVHGPSQIVSNDFEWHDGNWKGIDRRDFIVYEMHTGTFTPEGTFEAVIPRLSDLVGLGVNALEIMPVAQFPGERNWGYDGAYPFAVQNSYGGPDGLKKLVDACHRSGIAVVLDVVYNHFGPEGSYISSLAPYHTPKYRTPWGDAMNFDDAYCDGVRNFFIENALYWLGDFHIDALRLDAVHAIFDASARPFLAELARAVRAFSNKSGRDRILIAESDLNDSRVIRPAEDGGQGFHAQWCDDFHHALHASLTQERQGYYIDYEDFETVLKAFRDGFVYSGQYSRYRKKTFGSPSQEIPPSRFIVFSQNHDQTGNRKLGERLSALVEFEALKLAAGAVLFSPYIPMIFMGEEYGETAPFLYFVDHGDPDLVSAVREGRCKEFEAFNWRGKVPDPKGVETFVRSKLNWGARGAGRNAALLEFYRSCIALRKTLDALARADRGGVTVTALLPQRIISIHSRAADSETYCLFNFRGESAAAQIRLPPGTWLRRLDSAERIWQGPGSALPETAEGRQELMISGFSVSLFERK